MSQVQDPQEGQHLPDVDSLTSWDFKDAVKKQHQWVEQLRTEAEEEAAGHEPAPVTVSCGPWLGGRAEWRAGYWRGCDGQLKLSQVIWTKGVV